MQIQENFKQNENGNSFHKLKKKLIIKKTAKIPHRKQRCQKHKDCLSLTEIVRFWNKNCRWNSFIRLVNTRVCSWNNNLFIFLKVIIKAGVQGRMRKRKSIHSEIDAGRRVGLLNYSSFCSSTTVVKWHWIPEQ